MLKIHEMNICDMDIYLILFYLYLIYDVPNIFPYFCFSKNLKNCFQQLSIRMYIYESKWPILSNILKFQVNLDKKSIYLYNFW